MFTTQYNNNSQINIFFQIADGGVVKEDGRLKVGMRIVEVNGVSLLGGSHKTAVKALRNYPDLSITACDGFDPEEVLKIKAETEAMEAERMSSITASSHSESNCEERWIG